MVTRGRRCLVCGRAFQPSEGRIVVCLTPCGGAAGEARVSRVLARFVRRLKNVSANNPASTAERREKKGSDR